MENGTNDMTRMRPGLAVVFLLAVWGLGYALFGRAGAVESTDELAAITRSEDFRLGARDVGPDQCLALLHQDAETVVIGSSHVYAGVNSQVLEEESRDSTGVCALPRWNTDILDPFAAYLDRNGIVPDRLVWITDPATFLLQPATDPQRLEDTKRLLSERRLASERAEAWIDRTRDGRPPLSVSGADVARRIELQTAALAELMPNDVSRHVLDNSEWLLFRAHDTRLRLEDNPRNGRNLARFCRWIDAKGVALDIAGSPIPPLTAEIGNYSAEAFEMQVRAQVPCASRTLYIDAAGWGLDIRHYVNRKLLPDYDYAVWSADAETFAAHIEGMSRPERVRFLDADHLNGTGAVIFTKALVAALELD